MKIKNKIFAVLAIFIMFIALLSAIDFNPNGDINMQNIWSLKNAKNISVANLTVTGSITGFNNKLTLACQNITGSAGNLCINQTLAAITESSSYTNTASTNLQVNISAVNSSAYAYTNSVNNTLASWLSTIYQTIINSNTMSNNLQSNITAVNTSLIAYTNTNFFNKSANINLANGYNVTFGFGGYIKDNGTAVIIGHS
jgi:hypothetical protein